MKLFLFAMLLTVAQAPSPITRKAPNSPTDAGYSVTKDGNSDKRPSAQPLAPVKLIAAEQQENPSKTQNPEDAQQSVRIRELPPVSVRRDWADWGIWAFSGLFSLGELKTQARIFKKKRSLSTSTVLLSTKTYLIGREKQHSDTNG